MYRVIISTTTDVFSEIGALEQEYNEVCNRLQEIEKEYTTARQKNLPDPQLDEEEDRLDQREIELYNQLYKIWKLNPHVVSRDLAMQFEDE